MTAWDGKKRAPVNPETEETKAVAGAVEAGAKTEEAMHRIAPHPHRPPVMQPQTPVELVK
jgi:hypothetical protein